MLKNTKFLEFLLVQNFLKPLCVNDTPLHTVGAVPPSPAKGA